MTKVSQARKISSYLIERSNSSPHHTSDSNILAETVYKMYFIECKTQREIADVLGFKSTQPVRRIFREMGWKTRYSTKRLVRREEINDDEVRLLYFKVGLTQRKIAQKLRTSLPTIRRIFFERGWQVRGRRSDIKTNRRSGSKPLRGDILDIEKEVYRLYFDEGLSQVKIALKLGYRSDRPIRRIFTKNGWLVRRSTGLGTKKRVFESEEERQVATREHKKQTERRITDLRNQLFGTKCRICGCIKEERKIAIHKKDGKAHNENHLWRIIILESIDSDEWVALCIACHRGVHWLMKTYNLTWNEIESLLKKMKKPARKKQDSLELPDDTVPSSEQYKTIKSLFNGNSSELRKQIFGDDCHFCGSNFNERRLVLHRKDGITHNSKLIEYEKHFRTLDPNEWVSLCQKCHRYIHWAMDTFNMTWSDLKKDGAPGGN